MKRKLFSIGSVWFISLLIITPLASAQVVPEKVISFPDAGLEAAIRFTLRLPHGVPITNRAILDLTEMERPLGEEITDLAGLEYATNLRKLRLSGPISDISPLVTLTQLRELRLWDTRVSDISPLTALTQLQVLRLWPCPVSDISPLATLTQLRELMLSEFLVSDISPLATLTQLRRLDLWESPVSDISPLATLTQLRRLELLDVPVSDISPLAILTQLRQLGLHRSDISDISPLATLTQLQVLTLQRCPVSDISPLATLTQLQGLTLRDCPVSDISPLATLTQLRRLELFSVPVSDISPLATLTQLWKLHFYLTDISDISPLATLTQLRELSLSNNRVSDISALTALTQLEKLGLGENPLTNADRQTHIPTIQANGTSVGFTPLRRHNLAEGVGLVSLVYLRPNDVPIPPNVNENIDRLIKKVQRFYADEMERHGFGRKTFQFEMDEHGNAVVHHVVGKFGDAHYRDKSAFKWRDKWRDDIREQVYIPAGNITVWMVETAGAPPLVSFAGYNSYAWIFHWDWKTLAHELGHAFGLGHNFRDGSDIMSYGPGQTELSQCAAGWVDGCRAFNTNSTSYVWDYTTNFVMHPPRLVPNGFHLRFEVTSSFGLHQVMLLIPWSPSKDTVGPIEGPIGCRQLNGKESAIVEFVVPGLTPEHNQVALNVMNKRGSTRGKRFSIDVSSLVEVITFPDPNLGKAVRESLNLPSSEDITTQTMLWLTKLEARNSGITDLTGLEHAKKLRRLDLGGKYVSGKGYVNSNTISDFTPLEKLTRLKLLNLSYMQGLDVSSLAFLTQLEELDIEGTDILNIALLTVLTQLESLNLSNTPVSDVSALAAFTQLESLNLSNTSVSDVSALAAFTQLESLNLSNTSVSDVSALTTLTQLEYLNLRNTGVSDVDPLAALIHLEYLNLRWNFIWDVLLLAELAQLKGSRDWHGLYLEGNPLSYASVNRHIPALQAKGVKVRFENRAHSALVRVSGDRQEGSSGEMLQTALVVKAQDSLWKPMSGVDVKFSIVQGNGTLSTQTATTDTNGRAKTILTLGKNKGLNKVRVTATGIKYPVTFTATATEPRTQLAAAAPQASPIALPPEETALLPNYPNPFNPETWIPYQLMVPANVTLTIYASNGAVVRTLTLGHQAPGIYQSKSRAAYWDGRNHIGEHVASGVYFYTLSAGDFTATRKLLIRK